MDFDAVKKHLWPLSPEEADALARKHCSGPESAVTLADVYPPEVVADPDIMGGTPCMSGSRLPITTLVACADKDKRSRIVDSWPWLTPAHVDAARAWLASPPPL